MRPGSHSVEAAVYELAEFDLAEFNRLGKCPHASFKEQSYYLSPADPLALVNEQRCELACEVP